MEQRSAACLSVAHTAKRPLSRQIDAHFLRKGHKLLDGDVQPVSGREQLLLPPGRDHLRQLFPRPPGLTQDRNDEFLRAADRLLAQFLTAAGPGAESVPVARRACASGSAAAPAG
jgi:hypothetical protein